MLAQPWNNGDGRRMDKVAFLAALRESLNAITVARYYKTERGFQGALLTELSNRLGDAVLPSGAILEQEYQKTLAAHNLTIRPDIIVHEPFDEARHSSRQGGNHAVMELKLRANEEAAAQDLDSLGTMMDVLHYPLGIFINVDSTSTYSASVPHRFREKIVCFAVRLAADGSPQVVEG